MKTLTAALAAILLSCIANVAAASCVDRIDISKLSGTGAASLPKAICEASVMTAVLESARVWDSVVDASGRDLFAVHSEAIKVGDMTYEDISARSAKMIMIEFRADGILTFSMTKLRKKIEQYMADTYIALFEQPEPLRLVKISVLYPMSDGKPGVVYGTEIWNDGQYGPDSLPKGWDVWRLHRDLR